jgi:predicted RNA-binding Zn-ribbon protein involved in translation (DUF1610 family)
MHKGVNLGFLKNLKTFLKSIQRTSPKPIVCPKCGSTKIRLNTSISGWLIPEEYICDECGYTGAAIEVKQLEEE